MINLRFSLENPFTNRFENVFCKSGKTLLPHKYWEVQVIESDDIVSFDLRITTRQDHSGVDLWLGLFGYSINLHVYDSRHWDHEKDQWCVYGEEK